MKFKVHEVWFGSKPDEQEWADKRTEIWARMREWLGGGCLPKDRDLQDDLVGPDYKFVGAGDKIKLESKEEMKRRGLASPDAADALACTFAIKVARRDTRATNQRRAVRIARDVDYSLF